MCVCGVCVRVCVCVDAIAEDDVHEVEETQARRTTQTQENKFSKVISIVPGSVTEENTFIRAGVLRQPVEK